MNEEQIKSYFLGKLAAPEAESFMLETAVSEDLTEQAHLIESELIDDYLRSNLSPGEKLLFENNYLITETRREKLKTARNLWKIVAEEQKTFAAPSTHTVLLGKSIWQTIFGHPMRLAFGGLILMFILAGIGWLWKISENTPEIAVVQHTVDTPDHLNQNRKDIPEPSNENLTGKKTENTTNPVNPGSQEIEPNKKTSQPSQIKPEVKTTPKTVEPSAPSLAIIVLKPGILRGEGESEQSIKISPPVGKIPLHLELPADAEKYQSYRAVLKDAEMNVVATFSNPKKVKTVSSESNSESLEISLPVSDLQERTYLIFLEGKNAGKDSESVTEYTFRVRR